MTTPDQLSHAIKVVRDNLILSKQYPNYAAIHADFFANEVADELETELNLFDPSHFMVPAEYDIAFDVELLEQHWPNVYPPANHKWGDMNQMASHFKFSPTTHVFIELDQKFYDAECPDGTSNFFRLPFFKRLTKKWHAHWVLQTLTKSQEVIRDPKNWAQEWFAYDDERNLVTITAPEATCWCTIGAIRKAGHELNAPWGVVERTVGALVNNLPPELAGEGIPRFNDNHTHEDVMDLFDRTLERLKC